MASKEVQVILKHFVKDVVVTYENLLNYYIRRLEDNIKKPDTLANFFMNLLELGISDAEYFDDSTKDLSTTACDVLIKVIYASNVQFNRNETKKLFDQLYLFKTEPATVRNVLEDFAYRLFQSFESQFIQAAEGELWEEATIQLAKDAVSRATDYYKTNQDVAFSADSIIHGVIFEHSKEQSDGIVQYKSLDWNTTQLFSKIDLSDKHQEKLEKTLGELIIEKSEDIEKDLKHLESCIADNIEILHLFIKNNPTELKEYLSSLRKHQVLETSKKLDEEIVIDCQFRKSKKGKQPFWFGVVDQLPLFIGRKQQFLAIDEKLKQNDIVVICGLDGVGKSALAVEYIYNYYYEKNNFVIHVDTSTEKTALQEFKELHKKLGLKSNYEDGEIKSTQLIVEEIYELVGNKGLFIFDNAENYTAVKEFLPLTVSCKSSILITSPIVSKREWASRRLSLALIVLDNFTDTEAIEFVKVSLNISSNEEDNDIKRLMSKLNNFPLALNQAVTYIKDKKFSFDGNAIKKKLADYVYMYDENPKAFLSCKIDNNTKTVFKIIEIIENKIEIDAENGKQAADMLNILSYFGSNNIPENIFFNELAEGNEDKMIDITNLLKKYAILYLNNGLLTIHSLIQEVLRLILKDQKKEFEYLKKALDVLKKKLNSQRDVEIYSPHVASVWKYACEYNDLITTYITDNDEGAYTTFFHVLVEHSDYEIVNTILNEIKKRYPDQVQSVINKKDNERGISLHNAASSGKEEIVKLLIQNGAKVNVDKKHEWRPLHLAVKNGSLNVVKALLENDAYVNCKTGYKYTPLHLASRIGRSDIVKCLLSKGADVNATANHGETSLHFAVKTNQIECVEALLKNDDVNVNAETQYKLTPLHFAVKGGHLNIVKILLKKQAEINVKNIDKFTPLHFASVYNYLEIVNELLAIDNIDINAQTAYGNTPLHLASERGNVKIVEALVKKKAKVNIVNNDGKTATDLAEDQMIKTICSSVQ